MVKTVLFLLEHYAGVPADLEGGLHNSLTLHDLVEEAFDLDAHPGAQEDHVGEQDAIFEADPDGALRALLDGLLDDAADAGDGLHGGADELLRLERRVEELGDVGGVLEDLEGRA